MNGAALVFSSVFSVIAVASFALTFVPFYARWSAFRHAVLIGVDLPARLEGAVSARLMTQVRGTSMGVFVAMAVATLVVFFEIGGDSRLTIWLIVGAVGAGAATGVAVAAFTDSPKIATDGPRIARSGAVSVGDYIHPAERIASRGVIALAVVVAIISTVALGSNAAGSVFPTVAFAILGVISLALFEVVSRRIVDRPQPAGSTAELVWDDAIRTSTLRDLLAAPLVFGVYSFFFGIAGLLIAAAGPTAPAAADLTGIVSTIALLAITFYSRAVRPQRYFIGRLWPNLRWSDTADDTADVATDAAKEAN